MAEPVTRCRIAIIGGGAAGLMAAISAARVWQANSAGGADDGPIPVMIIEKLDRVGKKLLTTGNGRCNLSNTSLTLNHYHGRNPEFASHVLEHFPVSQTLDLFRQLGLLCRAEGDRLYPYSLQASAVLDILRIALKRLGVGILTDQTVISLTHADRNTGYLIRLSSGQQVFAGQVIVATGGLAAPGLGCDGSGYALMAAFGHRRTAVFPALVQIRTETSLVRGLAGIKFDGTATIKSGAKKLKKATGEILLTEYGLSGPPMLDLSRSVAEMLNDKPDQSVDIVLDLLPEMSFHNLTSWLAERRDSAPELELSDYLTGLLNKKLGQAILKQYLGLRLTLAAPVTLLTDRDLPQIASLLKSLAIRAVGTRDWTQAQVTAGGLETGDFLPDTLESRHSSGLYAAGEILDIDGDCGGYNLQWAWSSGQAAGRSAMLKNMGEIDR